MSITSRITALEDVVEPTPPDDLARAILDNPEAYESALSLIDLIDLTGKIGVTPPDDLARAILDNPEAHELALSLIDRLEPQTPATPEGK